MQIFVVTCMAIKEELGVKLHRRLELRIDPGLRASNIKSLLNDSHKLLQTDYMDIYYAPEVDQTTPLEEMLEAFIEIIK